MKAVLSRLLLRIVGRAYQIRHPAALSRKIEDSTLSDQSVIAPKGQLSTEWHFARVGLKAGWYMLEVEHSSDSIGCVLTLQQIGSDTAHLRLASKKICKRIVWFAGQVSELAVSIDQPDSTLNRLTLIALSSSFAMSRIQQRFENRGGLFFDSAETVADAYNNYQVNLHGSIFSKPYRYVEKDLEPACKVDSAFDAKRALVHLKLKRVDADDAGLCHSVEQALEFARNLGWVVDWHTGADLVPVGECGDGKSAYLMPVKSGVKYRADVIHQLLSTVSEDTVIVYADHDDVDEDGQHFNPILKPDWNPELLLNFNYIDLPWIVSESWFDCVNAGLPVGERGEDAVLLAAALRGQISAKESASCMAPIHEQASREAEGLVAALRNVQVKHVPDILASRVVTQMPMKQDSTSRQSHWQRSVEKALERAGSSATVSSGKLAGSSRVSWSLPVELPAVDIIVPTKDKVDVLRNCLESVLSKTQYSNFRIIIADNQSCEDETERYYQSLENEERVTLLRYQQPFNYSAINNFAVACTDAPILVLLNNDTEVISSNWLDELVRQALRPEVGCVGAKLHYSNGRIQHAGVVVGITGVAGHAFRYERGDDDGYCGRLQASQNYTAVTAACLAVRRETYLKVGGFDQEYLSVAWNDVDFCMKVQASGLRNVWTPYAELFHHEGLSRGSDDTVEKVQRVNSERKIMLERWALNEFQDPAYHPLLMRDSENFGLGITVT